MTDINTDINATATEEAPVLEQDVADESTPESATATQSEDSEQPAVGGGKAARLERDGEIAADYLETLLDIADLDGDIEVDVDGDRAAISIVDSDDGRAPRSLVGPRGKVLEALQELTRLAVQAETGDRSRLMLDIAGHRSTRRTQLESVAHEACEKVRSSGQPQSLEPMSAFERKVVHDAVLKEGLGSESEGAEPNRRVVVLPA
ncbi:R3H domain-containing nucleic acid-binding protein [Branchiibius sp. NY16-3462-2]|uniref:Jag family protein n=1 Tax=Branchiibius sp. NY16-3462-2 TaxID=1807500 RepID=UPI0007914A52|nr:R3H domain-containing nucleic acid-binding protein [Branchiibius sp. NY16-3462-2]KYH44174.1 RNA-binding protein [Branchiibius sp. NY16-3462-2]